LLAVLNQNLCFRIVDENTLSQSCNPDISILAFQDFIDIAAYTYTVLCPFVEVGKRFSQAVKNVQTLVRAYPDIPFFILVQGTDKIVPQRVLDSGIVTENAEISAIEEIQPIAGAKPHEIVAILQAAPNRIV
jgi:hypothetical protein